MSKAFIVALVVLAIVLILLWVYWPTLQSADNPAGDGVVERAWNYCKQFNELDCNAQAYTGTDMPNREPIDCYWNTKTQTCQAGIGYM